MKVDTSRSLSLTLSLAQADAVIHLKADLDRLKRILDSGSPTDAEIWTMLIIRSFSNRFLIFFVQLFRGPVEVEVYAER